MNRTTTSFFRAIILETPTSFWWISVLVWLVRVATFSLVLRSYLFPWLLSHLLKHVRVRSISLRSIRGLYIRAGLRIIRIDRVRYGFSRQKGLNVRLDGLNVDMGKIQPKPPTLATHSHHRRLTLADLGPSPMARRLWNLISWSYSSVEPTLRPIIRTCVVASLRLLIRWLPHIVSGLNFEAHSTTFILPGLPGTSVSAEKLTFHSKLSFTDLESVIDTSEHSVPRSKKPRPSYGVAAWRKRLMASFRRSLDRAWGKAQGNASIAINLYNIGGLTQSSMQSNEGESVRFLHLPGAIDFGASMKFDPRQGSADTHSLIVFLNIGDCYLGLDTLKLLLINLKSHKSALPSSPSPSHFKSDVLIASLEGNGGFSRSSPKTASPPGSALGPDVLSPISPSSPFFEALSASIRPRSRHPHRSCVRLKDFKKQSVLSVLKHASVNMSSVTFTTERKGGQDPYELKIQKVTLQSSVCDEAPQSSLHRRWLGHCRNTESYDFDAYSLTLSIHQIFIERRTKLDNMRLFTLAAANLHMLATQWPTPWLQSSPFLAGDPNEPFLAFQGKIDGIEFTERLDRLRELIAHTEPTVRIKDPEQQTTLPDTLSLPRLSFDLQCGTVRGRIICADTDSSEPFALELRNNGLVVSAVTSYTGDRRVNVSLQVEDQEKRHPLRMDYRVDFLFQPTLIRLRSRMETDSRHFTDLRSFDADFLDDPSLLLLEAFRCSGDGHAIASMVDDVDTVAQVESSSALLDLCLSSEAIYLEIWNPRVVTAVHQLFSIIPAQDNKPLTSPKSPLLDSLPAGVSISLAIVRFVASVAASDINPDDSLELSRGFTCKTGLSLHYSSMHSRHAYRFRDLSHRAQTRQKLYLPEEYIVAAVSAARASVITHNASAHIGIVFWNLALRSSVATGYEIDEASIFERDDGALDRRQFLHIPSIRVALHLAGKRGPATRIRDTCEVSVIIPSVKATFQLGYAYSAMLAVQTIKSFIPHSLPRQTSHQPAVQLVYRVKVAVSTVQVLSLLRTQKFAIRVDGIDAQVYPGTAPSARLHQLFVWVCLPSRINKWEDERIDKWEELFNFKSLHAHLSFGGTDQLVSLEGENSRLRIPFGYALSELITDLTVTAKAIRHLAHITGQGRYSPMPVPEPEKPKVVPSVTIRLRHLCLEAADDSFESKLAVIWRCGREAVKQRIEREDAFQAKVAAIYKAESDIPSSGTADIEQGYQFGATHSVSIEEARRRLDGVHELDWTLRLQEIRQGHMRLGDAIEPNRQAKHSKRRAGTVPNIVEVAPVGQHPPLFRALLDGLLLTLQQPSFSSSNLADFLHKQGSLPHETQFSLLVPLHLHFTLSSLHMTLRDYPLPLASIPPNVDRAPSWEFDTDLVVAEEMGTDLSVEWIDCPIIEKHHGIWGSSGLTIAVPKTIMPVKTYANPVVHVTTNATTTFSWGVSYTPAVQDLMKVIETLSTAPRDASPSVGFWDKIRLLFHWSLVATFKQEVRFYLKGSRDPHKLSDDGAGFVLSWQGNAKLLVAQKNKDNELIQVASDSMYIAIPNLKHLYPHNQTHIFTRYIPETSEPFRKICAKLRSGVRFGVGFVLERACGAECLNCSGMAFHRKCRHFQFLPHYNVRLEKKAGVPVIKSSEDSYNGFRSDFIHLSLSLISPTQTVIPGSNLHPNSIHLTPKAFAHFWSWCDLFDSTLSLPTRQGSYYPPRIISPKFGRHLATLKYRLSIRNLFIMHAYIDESRETWVDGVIPWIGLKGLIEELQADLHQRDEESVAPGLFPDTEKVLRRKPVYAAEVCLKGLDLRVLLATFKDPPRKAVEMISSPQRGNYRAHQNLPITPSASVWHDSSDFVEIDWFPSVAPKLHLLPVATCPHFAYFKRNSSVPHNSKVVSKFGLEGTHSCFLGQAQSVPQVQIEITENRMTELRRLIRNQRSASSGDSRASVEKMVTLLEEYVSHLRSRDSSLDDNQSPNRRYLMPSFTLSPDEWDEFENVYHVHCPKVSLDSATRDIILQYYYCSQDRKGLEYHMATRAVKFIRDQAGAVLGDESDSEEDSKSWGATTTAHMAASALRKMLKGETAKPPVDIMAGKSHPAQSLEEFNPLQGWSEGVSLRKSHCCLLLKPQIVLHGEGSENALAVAAVQAKLQAFAVMDDTNADDPISGKVMSRSHTSLSGLQTFAPAGLITKDSLYVPLEVLIDLRCESNLFDQLVPQTDATFQYDKFNRLRLRNNVTSVTRTGMAKSTPTGDSHLQDQTDLIRVHIPRFTVSANDQHFQAISHIVTKLLLFSDAAHKTRMEKLETLLFTYDFTDLVAAAKVIANLQDKLGDAIEAQRTAEYNHSHRLNTEEGQLELLKLKAHIFLLSEELNYLFDAIKLAQDRYDDQSDQKSALLLHASSSEISWRMLDERRGLLSKLVVQDINFYWLSRQDSSTSNNLAVSNLQAFDGSRHATWTEILSKHDEPANHPLLKRGLFLLASWTVLAPVGGITIYESFELSLHPMRLQIDARVGQRMMDYLWPARKERRAIDEKTDSIPNSSIPAGSERTSLDSPRALYRPKTTLESNEGELTPLRKLGSSRSFTDLRGSLGVPTIHKMPSSETFRQLTLPTDGAGRRKRKSQEDGDAAEMKTRASQKSFVLVKLSSLDLLLSIVKEGSFECHDARIKTRELVYRNQTLSFEELVNQFVPSDMSWRGWVKMAFHQPLLPVLPVARELISKTKLISSRTATQVDIKGPPPRLPRAKVLSEDDETKLTLFHSKPSKNTIKLSKGWRKTIQRKHDGPSTNITSLPLTDEPEPLHEEAASQTFSRKRMISLLGRGPTRGSPGGSSTTLRPP